MTFDLWRGLNFTGQSKKRTGVYKDKSFKLEILRLQERSDGFVRWLYCPTHLTREYTPMSRRPSPSSFKEDKWSSSLLSCSSASVTWKHPEVDVRKGSVKIFDVLPPVPCGQRILRPEVKRTSRLFLYPYLSLLSLLILTFSNFFLSYVKTESSRCYLVTLFSLLSEGVLRKEYWNAPSTRHPCLY